VTETTTITVPKIRDGEGQPTCSWWEHRCPFLMHSRFGTVEHCYWQTPGQGLLLRRGDRGPTIPHARCPVWHGQEVRP
jgi:hypothetical protein